MIGRRAFSLLEMILAMALLAGALVVLGELARMGMRSAAVASQTARAQLLCESKLAEVLAAPELVAPIQRAVLEYQFEPGEPEWLYSVEPVTIEDGGLVAVRVTVVENLPPEKRPVEVSLVRWLLIDQNSTAESTSDQEPSP